jgi:hypothetical protein
MSEETNYSLDEEKIIERLRINDAGIINEISKTVHGMFIEENRRTEHITSKGSSFAGIIGLTSGLVFSLGGILIEKISNNNLPIIGCPIPWLVLFYLTSFLTLLLALFYCLRAIQVSSDFRGLNDKDIYHEKMLEDEDRWQYKRYMITHVWKVFKNNFEQNNLKAMHLRVSQIIFIIALAQLIPIMMIISLYALKKGGLIL